jgi:hypothetical protein
VSDPLLFPRPRHAEWGSGTTTRDTAVDEREATDLPAQGYALDIGEGAISLRFRDEAGRRYGRQTLAQLRRRPAFPDCRIIDHPDFETRGFMLDISRDRVPTRETLEHLVERLAALRYNHLQLYTEHTFAFREHETVWRAASPMTPDDVRWLDALCAERGIELAANQNVFGHMERWLAHEAYRERAETPGGFEMGGVHRGPSALAPTPDNAEFALALLRELLPNFRSRRINIGCDEVWELGRGASAAQVAERGKQAVFVEHLRRIAAPLLERGYEVQFWADMVQRAPEAARSLADAGAIAAVWGYEKPMDVDPSRIDFDAFPESIREVARDYLETGARGFGPRLEEFAGAGFRTWVVPGTSGWNSLVGRHPNARGNLLDAVESGLAHGAEGVLVTEWGDNGHMQPPFATLPALAYGGAATWCRASNGDLSDEDLAGAVDRLLDAPGGGFGRALVDLGCVAERLALPQLNGTAFFYALVRANLPVNSDAAEPEAHARALAQIDGAVARLDRAEPSVGDGRLLVRETRQAAAFARHGLDCLAARSSRTAKAPWDALRREREALVAEQRACWLARSRPGGLDDSLGRLRPIARST